MRQYYGLDFLRFFSAFLVVLFHFRAFGLTETTHAAVGDDAAFGWLAPISWFGWIGVQIFFVLSGFIISARARVTSPTRFLLKRGIRVLPALWVSALLAFAIRLAGGEPFAALSASLARSLVLSPKGPYIDGVIWTLVVEAVFYLFIAWVIVLASLRKNLSDRVHDLAICALGGVSALFLTLHTLSIWGGWVIAERAAGEFLHSFAFDVLMLRHGVFFALGMLLFQLADRKKRTLPRLMASSVLLVFCLLQIALDAEPQGPAVLPMAIWGAAVAWMVLSVLRPRPFVAMLGLLTYPLYLNHFTLGMYTTPATAVLFQAPWLHFCAMLTLVLAVSFAIMQGPERLLQKAGRRHLDGWSRQLDGAVSMFRLRFFGGRWASTRRT